MIHRIAMIPGDGIGKEVVPAAARVLDAAGQVELMEHSAEALA